MTNLELNGMYKQYKSESIEEATRNMRVSCEMCVTRGWHKKCETCPIAAAHETMMKNFELAKFNQEIEEKLIATNKRLGLA